MLFASWTAPTFDMYPSIVHKSTFHVSVYCVLGFPGKCNRNWHCGIVVGLVLDWRLINTLYVILVVQSGLGPSSGAIITREVFW